MPASASSARRLAFEDNWQFHLGEAAGAEDPQYDDSGWQRVHLPHDWAIEQRFDAALDPQTGALPVSGTGWYRNSFVLADTDPARRHSIEFDGAMANSRVWINGHELGSRPYGYSSFSYDLTPYLSGDGGRNVLAVRLAPEADASRWYPGAGIYRHVWRVDTADVHVAHWGTWVTTPAVSARQAQVIAHTELRNERATAAPITLRSSIVDQAGRVVASASIAASLAPRAAQSLTAALSIAQPSRWDTAHPTLYTLISDVYEGTVLRDHYLTPFGLRTLSIDRRHGVRLNGRPIKLHGVCLHHDLGALGAAVNRSAIERQLRILKAAGVNAIRTSHNPPSPELLDAADRMGLLVMDEAFDMWRIAKVPNGYSKYFDAWSERDLRDLVRRDRNHPSVILWSIGNEIPEQSETDGWKVAHRLTRIVHEEDPTRPTTAAFSDWQGAIRNGLAAEVDVPGFNYAPTHYGQILREHPRWAVVGSETASCVSSRGVYHLPVAKYEKHPSLQLSSYDVIAPSWAYCPDVEFAAQEADPALLGEFVWTGFDYLGEPTPYFAAPEDKARDWPARSSYFGMVDLAGFPKDRYYLYQSQWTRAPMVHLLPHWNWAGHEGEPIPVMAYSNAGDVELYLNGRSLGHQRTRARAVPMPVGENVSPRRTFASRYRLLWQVPYAPGTLRAVARRNGVIVATDTITTAGPPARLRLIADRSNLNAGGDDLAFITARVEDRDGNLCPLADNLLSFSVSAPGRVAGIDNGNAASVESFRGNARSAFNGLALLIVGVSGPGEVRVTATADGLEGHALALQSQP